jgi:hypothetical protein
MVQIAETRVCAPLAQASLSILDIGYLCIQPDPWGKQPPPHDTKRAVMPRDASASTEPLVLCAYLLALTYHFN